MNLSKKILALIVLALPVLTGVVVPASASTTDAPTFIVHGFVGAAGCPGYDNAKFAAPLKQVLAANGYSGPVMAVDWLCGDKNGVNIKPYGTQPAANYNATMKIETIADTFANFLRANYAGVPVNCVGHSMGGLICNYVMKHYPDVQIANGVSLSTPFKGWDRIPAGTMGIYCGGYVQCQEMTTGSAFLRDLESIPKPATTRWTCIGGGPADNVTSINSACGTDEDVSVDYFDKTVVNYNHSSYMTDSSMLLNLTAKINGAVSTGQPHSLNMTSRYLR